MHNNLRYKVFGITLYVNSTSIKTFSQGYQQLLFIKVAATNKIEGQNIKRLIEKYTHKRKGHNKIWLIKVNKTVFLRIAL